MTFEEMGVHKELVKALQEQGITSPTLIQQKAIPLIKAGKDVIGMSKTGSGKTAAFGIPLLESVEPGQGVQVLIVTPTRELAVQISNEMKKWSRYLKRKISTVYGGVAINPQIENNSRADIVVGTPGRLLDHLQRETLDLSGLKVAVLDEADKMVEMGFIEDIENILGCTPDNRQVLLFGATISDEIDRLKQRYMKQPAVARAEAHVKDDFLEQYYYNVQPQEKFSLLVHLLKKEQTKRVIIFCSTRRTVEIVSSNLRSQGIKTEMIHGKLAQNRRLKVMESFNRGHPDVLVASAVAARGLDIKDVTHILNFDLSQDPQEYIHRVGRTARAGETGKAITLLGPKDYGAFNDILSRYRELKVEELPLEDFPRLQFKARMEPQRSRFGGRGNFNRGPRRFGNRSGGSGSHRPRSGGNFGNRSGGSRPGGRFGNRSGSGQGSRPGGNFGNRSGSGQGSRPGGNFRNRSGGSGQGSRPGGRFGNRSSGSGSGQGSRPGGRKPFRKRFK